jgi:hypothetical protein
MYISHISALLYTFLLFISTQLGNRNQLLDNLFGNCLFLQGLKGFPISGPILQCKEMEFTKLLEEDYEFKASNGWIDSFKKRHKL